jgi:FtsP/CotA-like multicopper oxidase with cupredoxin domain
MKKVKSSTFKLNPIAASIVLAMASQLSASVAYAGAGWGDNTDISGNPIRVQTFYASSPSGLHPQYDAAGQPTGAMSDSGTALRKFVDPLRGAYNGLDGDGITVAIPDKWVDGNGKVTTDDYYEIAAVEYLSQMHRDLAKPTRLRGYVQIETDNIRTKGLKDATGIVGSEHIPGTYLDGTPIYKWKKDPVTGVWAQSTEQVFFVHKPSYLGSSIVASSGTPVRIKFTNYLPFGKDANGLNKGDLPLPVDEYIAGGGPVLDINGVPTGVKFTQNRVAIHWHGGDSPWISDGTPHQWFAPAGETAAYAAGLGKGAAAADVPDMEESGPGSYTLYYPNNLSGRFMMYHDHASGLTKLNAYTGEAAGYIVIDPIELNLVAKAIGTTLATTLNAPGNAFNGLPIGVLDSIGIPLVIQDKGFVPKDIAQQDARWDTTHWGQEGDLWFAHVYEPNQDPNSSDGTNPVGRWDWGPWFWPVFPSQYSLPSGKYGDVSATPESFMDTPVVNGVAYPTMTVDPKTYRFRILSIANDRAQNLSLFQAVDAYVDPVTNLPAPRVCDGKITPVVAALAPGQTGALAPCTEVRMVPAQPTAGFPATWPTDGRFGGVPDPATAGPDIVQIGNEGGLLPELAIHKAQPVTYETNVRSITVFNVLEHSLLLMGGERADVLIDFSKYAGQTLIMYNDAPAPMPGFDPRIDYFTGDNDNSAVGGAYSTLPGYGPNTRTVMQIKVNPATPAKALDTAALAAALPIAYAATQPKPIVPEAVYNKPFGTNEGNNYAKITTGSGVQPTFSWTAKGVWTVSGASIVNGGSGYTVAPIVTFSPPPSNGSPGKANTNVTATGIANLTKGVVTSITVTNNGSGYVATPTITLTRDPADTTGTGAVAIATTTATQTVNIINKAIQELFEPVYGRMNATLAVELPFSSALVATTVPLAYVDAPYDYYDVIKDGETQIWKITHNGVDSHPVHFHMVNVQVINRVGWDGTIKPPHGNELGWKETLRMNPLEDVIVAVRASRPVTPFGLPKSNRLLDPSQAAGSTFGFTQIDPLTGQAPLTPFSNVTQDFDNEYVWHCHILGHEENDFMRPFIFRPTVVKPDAPGVVTVSGNKVTWIDPTPFGGQDRLGVPTAGTNRANPSPTNSTRNEIGFKVQRVATTTVVTDTPTTRTRNGVTTTTHAIATKTSTALVTVATVPANTTSWTDTTGLLIAAPPSVPATTTTDPVTKVVTTTSVSYSAVNTVSAYNVAGETAGTATTRASGSTTVTAATSTTAATLTAMTTAANTAGAAAAVTAATPAVPVGLTQTASATAGMVTVSWTAVTGATSYIVTYGTKVATVMAPATSLDVPTGSAVSVVAVFTVPAVTTQVPAKGVTLTAVKKGNTTTGVTISWTKVTNASSYAVTYTLPGATSSTTVPVSPIPPSATPPTTYTVNGATLVSGKNSFTSSVMATVVTTPATVYQSASSAGLYSGAVASPIAFTATAGAAGTVVLTWANSSTNVNNVTGYSLSWPGATPTTLAATATGASVFGLTTGTSYTFSLLANSILAGSTTTIPPTPATTISSAPVTVSITAP